MARVVSTAEEFLHWLKQEHHIAVVMYFSGDMARFRKHARKMIQIFSSKRGRPTAAQTYTLEKTKARLALCNEAQAAERQREVHLIQRRGADGWVYLAKRRL